ncbi:MAG: enoyl-CoA hydratase/isomerase family protein [Armatimonadetes bacterium]|nr:enoyl-CoA hydratase/isomerase family protein [Armatimonadota bacterium]
MLQVQQDGFRLNVTLDRPEVRNAFNDELIGELTRVFRGIPEGVRAVVLRGNGPTFCAGGDLEWMRRASSYTKEENVADALKLAHLFQSIAEAPTAVIAMVQGAAFGGGCGVVAASDVAIAIEGTKFSFSEVKLGLIPGTISPFVMDKIGRGHSRSLFATGEVFLTDKALRIGLVHDVGSAEEVEEILANKLAALKMAGPRAIGQAKRLTLDKNLTLEDCAQRLAEARASEEGKEGVAAFLEKRKATFVLP